MNHRHPVPIDNLKNPPPLHLLAQQSICGGLEKNGVGGESSLFVGGGGWRGTGVQRRREVKPQEALQHKQWVTVCAAEALLDLRNCGAWPAKQKQAGPVRANINACVHACALPGVCLKPQHCTGKHLFQPVRSAANLGSNQTSFFSPPSGLWGAFWVQPDTFCSASLN